MKNKSSFGFAVFGCGTISDVHARSILEIENAHFVGAADIVHSRAAAFAEKYGGVAFSDYAELLASDEVDAVCICTPSGTHADLAIEALCAGKNVVLEKPMAINVHDCDRIIEACRKTNRRLTVISQMRERPDIIRAKEIIDSGKLGKIVLCNLQMKYYRPEEYYRGSWRGTKAMDGGGALMNQGIHGIDIMSYLLGEIKEESCQSLVRTSLHDIEVEDTVVAICEFRRGALGMISATTSVYQGFSRVIEVCGSRGSIIIRDGQMERLVLADENVDITYDIAESEGKSNNAVIDTEWHKRQICRFIKAIRGEEVPDLCDEYQGRIAVDLIEKIYNSTK
jgi:predicted dehydrogenase